MKITTKTTRQEMLDALNANAKSAAKKDKSLGERIAYTLKHAADATRRDLSDLTKEVITALGEQFVVPAAAQTAPTAETAADTKKSGKKNAPKTENLVKTTSKKNVSSGDDTDETPKKSGKNAAKKSSNEGAVTSLDGTDTEKTVQLAKQFPQTITIDGQTYAVDHSVKTIEDLNDESKEFEFAFYWTKRHLKQFPYFSGMGQPKSFNNDLDTCQLIYVSDDGKVAYAISDATEALYTVYPNDLEEVDGLRYCSGIEFQIYSRTVENDAK